VKIAWISPFAKASAIARYSTIVCDEIEALGHNALRICCGDAERSQIGDSHYRHDMDFATFLMSDRSDVDQIIYNLGNNLANHGALVTDDVPMGVFILHDVCYPHLFLAYCSRYGIDPHTLLDRLVPLGLARSDHRDIYAAVSKAGDPDLSLVLLAELDMVGWVTRHATQIVVHSPSVTNTIAQKTGLRVCHLPLAFWTKEQTKAVEDIFPLKHDKRTLSSFGHLNANKRVSSLIQAVGSDASLSKTWQIRIVGPANDASRTHYHVLAERQPHPVDLMITGTVDDATFDAEMRAADCISCLRRPSYESGSATLVMALAINGNILASQDSASAAIVHDIATMIPPDDEPDHIAAALRQMMCRTTTRDKALSKIRTRAREIFDARVYATGILEFLETATSEDSRAARFKQSLPEGGDIAVALRRWCGPRLMSAAHRMGPVLQNLEGRKNVD